MSTQPKTHIYFHYKILYIIICIYTLYIFIFYNVDRHLKKEKIKLNRNRSSNNFLYTQSTQTQWGPRNSPWYPNLKKTVGYVHTVANENVTHGRPPTYIISIKAHGSFMYTFVRGDS